MLYFIMKATSLKKISFWVLLALPLGMWGQSMDDAVGINTRKPTELLNVNGTVRIRELPQNGSTNSIRTQSNGIVSAAGKDQEFKISDNNVDNATHTFRDPDQRGVLHANDQGVIGAAPAAKPLFFHMPCMVLPLETTFSGYNPTTQEFVVDLYQTYADQFVTHYVASPTPTSTSAASNTAGELPVEQAADLEYYITYYDPLVFSNVSVDNDGKLHYKVIPGAEATQNTFMNVIFKVK